MCRVSWLVPFNTRNSYARIPLYPKKKKKKIPVAFLFTIIRRQTSIAICAGVRYYMNHFDTLPHHRPYPNTKLRAAAAGAKHE